MPQLRDKMNVDYLYTTEEILRSDTWQKFKELVEDLEDVRLSSFLENWLHPSKMDAIAYFSSPGSRPTSEHGHHKFKGGLAAHSVAAAELGKKICAHYRTMGHKVNTDLVVVGILLHDIGKAFCYKLIRKPENNMMADWEYTEESKLLHHIPIGYAKFSEAVREFNEHALHLRVPYELCLKIAHIILSHHGRLHWSSPVIPQFAEAYIVHSVEMLDGFLDGKYFCGKVPKSLYD